MVVQNRGKQKKQPDKEVRDVVSHIKRQHRHPIFIYGLNERLTGLLASPGFIDGVLVLLAFIGANAALSFYPLILIIILAAGLFFVTVRKPFLGLIILILLIMPMLVYQTPTLAWLYLVVMAGSLIYGYMYHRTLFFVYALVAFSFSSLGYIMTIPLFILAVLVVGYKRAITLAVLFMIAVVCLSAVTGVQNTSYIIYNASYAHTRVMGPYANAYVVPDKPGFNLLTFPQGAAQALSMFGSSPVISLSTEVTGSVIAALGINVEYYIPEMIALVIIVFGIDSLASASRSRYRGTHASVLGLGYPLIAVALSVAANQSMHYYLLVISFVLAPVVLFILEFYNVKIVSSLDIRKQDLRMKFGEAFEDIEAGNVHETFDDVANYAATKRELSDAVLAPIEERAISKAYNVKPARGILFFGPPGTGKTLMMRALANEIRAGFFYVKAPNLISAFPGETERMINNIFNIAKKNAPCVLFFDEIDSIAPSRTRAQLGDVNRQALSQLLVEMDGFQKTSSVIMVGATNQPNLLDPAMMRPGRFDKVIYLPPPDYNARKQIFNMYLSKLPISKGIDLDKIAEETERYTGADIKTLCDTVAQKVAQEASTKHSVLEITQQDIMDRVLSTKPSVTLAQIEQYQKFRLDFERSVYGQQGEESKGEEITMRDVVGLDEAKKVISDAIETPLAHPDLIKKYNIKSVNGILIFGPPGTGKTMIVRAIKSEMQGITMLEINGAELADQGIERATATIKEIFDRAKSNAPAIILLDEVEELVLKRGSASEYSAQITSEMLRELDGVSKMTDVIVIGTSNRPDAIDSAALRPGRFDKLVFVRPPNKEQRAVLFKANLKGVPVSDDLDYNALAEETAGYTGADIYHVCREAKTVALDKTVKSGDEEKIEMKDFETILQKTKSSAPESVVAQYLSFYSKYGER